MEIDEHCWMQILATIDVSAMSRGTTFYDELGYEVIPFRMIQVKQTPNSEIEPVNWVKMELTLFDASLSESEEDMMTADESWDSLEDEEDYDVFKEHLQHI